MIIMQYETDKRTNVKFKEYLKDQLLLIPPSLDEMITTNHPVRIVNQVIDRVERKPVYICFGQSIKDEQREDYKAVGGTLAICSRHCLG